MDEEPDIYLSGMKQARAPPRRRRAARGSLTTLRCARRSSSQAKKFLMVRPSRMAPLEARKRSGGRSREIASAPRAIGRQQQQQTSADPRRAETMTTTTTTGVARARERGPLCRCALSP